MRNGLTCDRLLQVEENQQLTQSTYGVVVSEPKLQWSESSAFITTLLLLPDDEFHLLHITFNLFLLLFAVIWRLQLWWIPSGHNSSLYKRTVWCRGTLWMCCICPLTLTQFPAYEPFQAILHITFHGNFTTPEWMVYFRKENYLTLQSVLGNQTNRPKVNSPKVGSLETNVMSPEIYSHVVRNSISCNTQKIKLNKAVRVIRIYLVL